MDALLTAHDALERKSNLSQTLNDVQSLIDAVQSARDAVAEDPDKAELRMANLQHPMKASFSKLEDDLKEVNKGLNQYQKALNAKFKSTNLPIGANESFRGKRAGELIERATAMHLLREGMFDVAKTFVREVKEKGVRDEDDPDKAIQTPSWTHDFSDDDAVMVDVDGGSLAPDRVRDRGHLQRKFRELYQILDLLQNQHDLSSAIAWSHEHSLELEKRGSNLEFELARLKFVGLYTSTLPTDESDFSGPVRALEYARHTFPSFSPRYVRETSVLLGSLAFSYDLDTSPYRTIFKNPQVWDDTAHSFTLDFCSLLNLPPVSPLRTATTAGGIALPTLSKVERIMLESRGQWTSVNELPVETPLPPGYLFHSIFVCPVSKEQATDANPPMMLPCGHVIAKESLENYAKSKNRMKCPYCPSESSPRDAQRVYIG